MTDHRRYQFLPDLLPEEYEALKASIAERGVEVPVIVDQDGETVDGFHRQRATDELGVFCPKEVREFETEAEKFELALRLNCRRRQLTREQKRDLIGAYLQRDPQIADNCLAEIIGGVSKNTVAEIRRELEATCQIDKFTVLRGRDGKDRPKKYKRIIANTAKEAEVACRLINHLPVSFEGKTIDAFTAQHGWTDRPRLFSTLQSAQPVTEHSEATGEYSTPQWLFETLDREFHFTLDAASVRENAKCRRYFTPKEDGLSQSWAGEIVWCNPPFNKDEIGKWVGKAFEESRNGATVVMLVPSRFKEYRWWKDCCVHGEVRFLHHYVRFNQTRGDGTANIDVTVIIFGQQVVPGMVRPLFPVDAEAQREQEPQRVPSKVEGGQNGSCAIVRKLEEQESVPLHPVEFTVSNTTAEDAEQLETLIGLKHTTNGQTFFFESDRGTNAVLLLNKIAEWFDAPGHRSIELHLSK